jgi:hypothetical protein
VTKATDVTRQWFDQLEKVLHAEAELAGLLGHGTIIGSAREFFVTRILRSVLPPSIHIGTGKVIGHDGSQSSQIDVIAYDPSFPVLEVQPGQGLYILEGVIVAIEVKSTLDKDKFHQALDNCLSVTKMPPSLMARSVKMSIPEMEFTPGREYAPFSPSTYIFSYRSQISSIETLRDHADEWWELHRFVAQDRDKLPEIIVAGSIVGLSYGRWFRPAMQNESPDDSKNPATTVIGFWQVERPFAWLLMHLLLTAAQRFSDSRKKVVEKYLPFTDYWQAELHNRLCAAITASSQR